MSYILDALRRADAERERDPARGIHAQPAAGAPAPSRGRMPPWTWPAAAAVILAVGGAIAWQRSEPEAVTAAPVAVSAPVAAPAPAPVAPAVPVAQAVSPPAPPVLKPPPAAEVPARQPAAAPAKAPVAAAPASAVVSTAAPSPERVFNIAELPADVQRELPKLAITGGVHSENAAQRMLIVGGQVVGEGAELAPGVVLEQIRARSAVLRYRTWRYSVNF